MTHDEILARFPDQRRGKAKCPAHEDRQASLQISEGADGRTLIHCHAGCSLDAILSARDLAPADLFREATREPRNGHRAAKGEKLGPIVATYDYTDIESKLLYQKNRYEPKTFRVRRPNGRGGWIDSLDDKNGPQTPRVLYRLPELQGQAVVAIAEGEKDVDNLRKRGIVATCGFGGASKDPDPAKSTWLPVYTEQLKAAGVPRVNIFRDDDEVGHAHATAVARSCHAAGLDVRLVELPNLPAMKGADVSDWLAAGHTDDELRAAIEHAQPFDFDAPRLTDGFRNDVTERTVLGDVLAHPAQLAVYRDTGFSSELFQHPAHPVTWQAIEALDERAIVPTREAVLSHLRTTGKLGKHGLTPEYLASLQAAEQPQPTITKLYADLTALVLCRDFEVNVDRSLKQLRRNPSIVTNGFVDRSIEQLESLRARRPNDPHSAFLTDVSIMNLPDTPQLIRGFIPGNALTLLSGPSGVGKTHLVLAAAMAVTLGAPLFGRFEVESPGHVLYIGLEGAAGLKNRIIAAKMAQECPLDHPLGIFFHFDAFSLLDNEQIDGVLRRIPPGVDIKLVIVDTYGKAILPGNENDTHDAGLAVEGMTRLRRETGAAVLGLHHLGANGDRERGNTALKAGMDAAIRLTAAGDGLKLVTCDKMRDAAPFDPWHFRLDPVGPSVVPMFVEHTPTDDDVRADAVSVPAALLDDARRILRVNPLISMTTLARRLSGRYETCREAARLAKAERGTK
jgi:hypothetical protein